MKQLKLFFALFAMLALGVGNAWGETVSNTWDLTSSSSDWTNEGCVTYFSQPYGIKKKGAYIINKNISDFIKYSSTATNIKIGVKSLCNGATSSKLTVSLVDASGNVVGTGLEITPDNATAASKTTYKYVTFTSNFANIAGYKVECTTFGKNVLINGTSYEITYTPSSSGETPGEGGGEDPNPDPEEPTPGTGGTGTINFNGNAVKINAASVTGQDNLNNTWTITTMGTTSFTSNSAYYQVGSSSKPATSITFTTTLPQEGTITAFSAKFGGFSGTTGSVTLKVDDTSVGTGSLNGTSDVVVENSSEATGKTLTVTVTGIAKGVKVYYISYTYTTSSGSGSGETVVSLIPKSIASISPLYVRIPIDYQSITSCHIQPLPTYPPVRRVLASSGW